MMGARIEVGPVDVAEWLRGELVLVEQTTESVAPADAALVIMSSDGNRLRHGRLLLERAVRPM